jgi:hypothetical protein
MTLEQESGSTVEWLGLFFDRVAGSPSEPHPVNKG